MQLVKSTLIAAAAAVFILVAIVLPSEYGIDPTGAGRLLGLTEMGEIKTQLAEEAEADRRSDAGTQGEQPSLFERIVAELFIGPAAAHDGQDSYSPNSNVTTIVLRPGEGMELKLDMHEGDQVTYSWTANGAVVNFDLHGENDVESISYKDDRAVPGDEGSFTAGFDGKHGWWWRNRTGEDVTIVLTTEGVYGEIHEYR
jgi:hypothetical protein